MSTKKISQREARRLRKRVIELEYRLNCADDAAVSDYPGTGLYTINIDEKTQGAIYAARRLGYGITAAPRDSGKLALFARRKLLP